MRQLLLAVPEQVAQDASHAEQAGVAKVVSQNWLVWHFEMHSFVEELKDLSEVHVLQAMLEEPEQVRHLSSQLTHSGGLVEIN